MVQPTRREKLREATLEEIKKLARQQMAQEGAGSISLRAIAAALGMTGPALYRYYSSRDDLLTTLIVEAYNSLAEAVEEAEQTTTGKSSAERLQALMLAYRNWGVQHIVDYNLIFGSPIPGYHAPDDATLAPARRSLVPFLQVLQEAQQAGEIRLKPAYVNLPPKIRQELSEKLAQYSLPLSPELTAAFMAVWGQMQGLISLEIFGHLQFLANDMSDLYQHHVRALVEQLGLT